MTAPNPKCFHLSASCIAAFKACPTRFRLKYREGLREDEDTDSLRIGTNWHAMHETYQNAITDLDHPEIGTEDTHNEMALQAVIDLLHDSYKERPASKTPEEWDLEKEILFTCFMGYLWYYQEDDIEYLCQELAFDLPVHEPRTGLPLPITEVKRVGKIDHIVRCDGVVGPIERKSTARSIEDGSQFWEKTLKDTQVSMYALALHDLESSGQLPFEVGEDDIFGNTIYDVWHKPTTKPKSLSQADTRTFLESGEYFGTEFEVEIVKEWEEVEDENKPKNTTKHAEVTVDGQPGEVEPGKKSFAIKETITMYCARLLSDIYERPEFYFRRREIARTDKEVAAFRKELFAIYQAQRAYDKHGFWFQNEQQCRATFACRYIPICYGQGPDEVCDGETTPPGFRRIFVDLTVEGSTPEDEG